MKYQNNIEPESCSGMEDIRIEIEKMYRDLVNHFINEEMSKWQLESANV